MRYAQAHLQTYVGKAFSDQQDILLEYPHFSFIKATVVQEYMKEFTKLSSVRMAFNGACD